MAECIKCGKETDETYQLYEAHIEKVERKEARTEYITQDRSQTRRVHYKVITSFDEIKEHVFGFCSACLKKNRKLGFKLLSLSLLVFMLPAIAIFFHAMGTEAQSGSNIKNILYFTGMGLGFIGAITAFMSLHYIFADTKTLPYNTKKLELNNVYEEKNNCKIFSPDEYDYVKEHGTLTVMNETKDFSA